MRGLATVLSDDHVADMLAGMARRKIAETQIGPPLGRIAADVFSRGDHHPLVDFIVERCYGWIRDNYTTVSRVVAQRAPSWSPRFLDAMLADRIYREVEAFARAVRDDPNHELRKALDRFLAEFASDLQTDPATMARADAIKDRVLANAQMRDLAGSAWRVHQGFAAASRRATPTRRCGASVRDGSESLRAQDDQTTRRRQPRSTAGSPTLPVTWRPTTPAHITGIIDETIARWDGETTSRKIELQVGRDLQFIRINGTVVGALAGLVIYTVATCCSARFQPAATPTRQWGLSARSRARW